MRGLATRDMAEGSGLQFAVAGGLRSRLDGVPYRLTTYGGQPWWRWVSRAGLGYDAGLAHSAVRAAGRGAPRLEAAAVSAQTPTAHSRERHGR